MHIRSTRVRRWGWRRMARSMSPMRARRPAAVTRRMRLIVARSTDGGKNFTNTEVARVYDDLDCYPIQQPGAQNRQTLSFEQFRINSFPSMAIDRSTGNIAIVWADNQGVGSCGTGGVAFTGGPTSNQVKLVDLGERPPAGLRPDDDYARAAHPTRSIRRLAQQRPDRHRLLHPRVLAGTDGPRSSCGIMELDTVTGSVVLPTDPAARRGAGVHSIGRSGRPAITSRRRRGLPRSHRTRTSCSPDRSSATTPGRRSMPPGGAVTVWTDNPAAIRVSRIRIRTWFVGTGLRETDRGRHTRRSRPTSRFHLRRLLHREFPSDCPTRDLSYKNVAAIRCCAGRRLQPKTWRRYF